MELQGKIIDFLGDSITEGVGVTDRANNRYDNVLKKNAGLAATYNYGIGGTRLAHQRKPSAKPRHDLCFCGRAYDLNKDADIIVVYGGINDYIHGDAPFGEIGDTTPATFCGGVYFLMNLIKTQHPDKTVVFMTSARLCYDGMDGSAPSHRPQKAPDAKNLFGYINAVKQTAAQFDIPVLDLYEKLGIDPTKPEDKEKYTADGLHFNDAGHHVLAARLQEFLEAL
ncbi:MAG: SGNH/GDSL hydrolase family protein [Oscillospiraceae bacterium]|nr:SGNH/GDSL hydrolase family protein [Oscillospiraceae bacterium]